MKVIVCGGPDFRGWKAARTALDFWLPRIPITVLIHGGRVSMSPADRHLPWEERKKWGADYIARRWAELRGVRTIEEALPDAEWKKLGGSATVLLNRKLLDLRPDRVIALPGGEETSDMLTQARMRGVKCIEVAQA